MNIQIFGTNKSQDTKKAQRFFKERRISFQMVDLREKSMSRGEFRSVVAGVKDVEEILDVKCKDQETLTLIRYLSPEDKLEKIFENQLVLRLPIVRNGKKAAFGYAPKEWENWIES